MAHRLCISLTIHIEQLSHELALKFADKCYSHLEIAHFKDNFKTLADHQDGIEYWKEETLCRFLSLPDVLNAGSVVYQMATYLGSFPFPSLAPCILTREAMLKVVTIFTGRYKKVLKRGDQDKKKLLFRSMAVFDRRMSLLSTSAERPAEKPGPHSPEKPYHAGFAIDEPANDEEEEDDDDLALAALDSLDAIEVFKEDQKKERKISQAHIPVENFHKLMMLLLLFAPVTPQDNIAAYAAAMDSRQRQNLETAAWSMVAAFNSDIVGGAIRYSSFMKTLTVTMPNLFRTLSPLFEHFLFSKNIDLSKHIGPPTAQTGDDLRDQKKSPIHTPPGATKPEILDDIILSQLSTSFEIAPTLTVESSSFFHLKTRFDELYSTASDGTSLSSFSRQVLSWKSPTLLLVSGTAPGVTGQIVLGAYLPEPWQENSLQPTESELASKTVLFQLRPRYAVFRANKYNKTAPFSHFSSKTGIALGCIIPAKSRVQAQNQTPVLGPVSLLIDQDISTATFQHDGDAGTGAFMTDSMLEEAQQLAEKGSGKAQPKKLEIDIDALEVWGISVGGTGEDEIENQKKRLAWEEAEAARRRGVNFGGDRDGARHLLEMAGIVGQNQSGGSV